MKTHTIGVKDLYTRLPKISEQVRRGHSFLVMRHARPIFRIEPTHDASPRKFSLKDLARVQFKSGKKNLSKRVDAIVYGS